MFKKFLQNKLTFNWKFGFALILIFGVVRFMLVLNAVKTTNYSSVAYIFMVMALLPFVLLNKQGRREIGIIKPVHYRWLFLSFLAGASYCSLVFLIGYGLYGSGTENWFAAIGKTYPVNADLLNNTDRIVYFIIFSLIGMTFSPVGEELLYRGLIHKSLEPRFKKNVATLIDSLAFGFTHLAHFGLLYRNGNWHLMLVPAVLWILLIFISGLLFNFCKIKTGSIAGAILSHAAFNLVMNYFIFFHLLR